MVLPGDIPCMKTCNNTSCPYCAFSVCMDNETCDNRRTDERERE